VELSQKTNRLTWPGQPLPAGVAERLLGPGGPFELTTDEGPDSTLEVFEHRPRSVVEALATGAARFPNRPYLVFPERTLTFDSVVGAVARVAEGMRSRFGIGAGDRIGIASANNVEYALAFWAATALGAITVGFNGWWTGPELG
jgi:hypothetical protein